MCLGIVLIISQHLSNQFLSPLTFSTVQNCLQKHLSQLDKKWVLYPKTHAMISDEENLEEGLNSLYLTVEETTEAEVNKIIDG